MSVILVAAFCTGCGAATSNLSEINFRPLDYNGQVISPSAIVSKLVAPGTTYAWGRGELQQLPETSLVGSGFNPLFVGFEYKSTSTRTEVALFARDPAEVRAEMQDLWAGGASNGQSCASNDSYWTSVMESGLVGIVPRQVLYPHQDIGLTQLSPSLFWPNGPVGPGTAPDGKGSIKSVWIYDHGACSAALALQPLLATVNDQLWAQFVAEADKNPDASSVIRRYSHVMSYLDHQAGQQTDARGGFVLDFFFQVDAKDPAGTIDMCFNANYRFALNPGGGLTLVPGVNHYLVDGINSQNLATDTNKALTKKVPEALREIAERRMIAPTGTACFQQNANNCNTVANVTAGLVDSGGAGLGLSVAERNQLKALILEPVQGAWSGDPVQYTGLRRWVCAPSEGAPSQPQCQYRLAGKRLNVYGDRLELVWFDGKEVNNPTYALWVALQGQSSQQDVEAAVGQLCSEQHTSSPSIPYFRSFVGVDGGHVSVDISNQ